MKGLGIGLMTLRLGVVGGMEGKQRRKEGDKNQSDSRLALRNFHDVSGSIEYSSMQDIVSRLLEYDIRHTLLGNPLQSSRSSFRKNFSLTCETHEPTEFFIASQKLLILVSAEINSLVEDLHLIQLKNIGLKLQVIGQLYSEMVRLSLNKCGSYFDELKTHKNRKRSVRDGLCLHCRRPILLAALEKDKVPVVFGIVDKKEGDTDPLNSSIEFDREELMTNMMETKRAALSLEPSDAVRKLTEILSEAIDETEDVFIDDNRLLKIGEYHNRFEQIKNKVKSNIANTLEKTFITLRKHSKNERVSTDERQFVEKDTQTTMWQHEENLRNLEIKRDALTKTLNKERTVKQDIIQQLKTCVRTNEGYRIAIESVEKKLYEAEYDVELKRQKIRADQRTITQLQADVSVKTREKELSEKEIYELKKEIIQNEISINSLSYKIEEMKRKIDSQDVSIQTNKLHWTKEMGVQINLARETKTSSALLLIKTDEPNKSKLNEVGKDGKVRQLAIGESEESDSSSVELSQQANKENTHSSKNREKRASKQQRQSLLRSTPSKQRESYRKSQGDFSSSFRLGSSNVVSTHRGSHKMEESTLEKSMDYNRLRSSKRLSMVSELHPATEVQHMMSPSTFLETHSQVATEILLCKDENSIMAGINFPKEISKGLLKTNPMKRANPPLNSQKHFRQKMDSVLRISRSNNAATSLATLPLRFGVNIRPETQNKSFFSNDSNKKVIKNNLSRSPPEPKDFNNNNNSDIRNPHNHNIHENSSSYCSQPTEPEGRRKNVQVQKGCEQSDEEDEEDSLRVHRKKTKNQLRLHIKPVSKFVKKGIKEWLSEVNTHLDNLWIEPDGTSKDIESRVVSIWQCLQSLEKSSIQKATYLKTQLIKKVIKNETPNRELSLCLSLSQLVFSHLSCPTNGNSECLHLKHLKRCIEDIYNVSNIS